MKGLSLTQPWASFRDGIRESRDFRRFIDILLPDSGYLVTLEAYLDESQLESGVFGVAGYLFEAPQAKRFDKEWRHLFGSRLPFHMVDLAAGKGLFKDLPRKDCDKLLRGAVEIIKKRVTLGIATSCNVKDFAEIASAVWTGEFGHPYTVCAHFCMGLVSKWLKGRQDARKVAYLFESGHLHMAQANSLFTGATKFDDFMDLYQYQSHGFIVKNAATPLQAADLFAWEWAKYCDETHWQQKRPMRGSLLALAESKGSAYQLMMLDRLELAAFYRGWQERAEGVGAEEIRLEPARVKGASLATSDDAPVSAGASVDGPVSRLSK